MTRRRVSFIAVSVLALFLAGWGFLVLHQASQGLTEADGVSKGELKGRPGLEEVLPLYSQAARSAIDVLTPSVEGWVFKSTNDESGEWRQEQAYSGPLTIDSKAAYSWMPGVWEGASKAVFDEGYSHQIFEELNRVLSPYGFTTSGDPHVEDGLFRVAFTDKWGSEVGVNAEPESVRVWVETESFLFSQPCTERGCPFPPATDLS